jgi:hypothetical protein
MGSFIPDTKVIAHPDFAETMSAVATIIFAFSGTPAFFPIVAEMRNPQHYVRSMLICQATVCTVYLVIGVVVYTYCGSYVASPALGSAGPLMKKVCYGLALPGLLVSGTMVSHVSLPNSTIPYHLPPDQSIDQSPSSSIPKLTPVKKVPSKIPLRPPPPHLPAPNLPDPNPPRHLDPLHFRHRNSRLHHRERGAEFQQPDSPHRRSPRDFHLLPADGLHVVVRQLGFGRA